MHKYLVPAVAGVFSTALVTGGAVLAVRHTDHVSSGPPEGRHESLAASAVTSQGSLASVGALRGRWVAVSLDGQDISGWRDISGLPANIIIGADRKPNEWQVNQACGPQITGRFALRADGSLAPIVPPPFSQHCPMLRTGTPNLRAALARTVFITVDGRTDANSPRTLNLLDDLKKPIMSWREDTAIRQPAGLCRQILSSRATYDGAFTITEQIRRHHLRDKKYQPGRVSMGVPPGTVAVYCHAIAAEGSRRFAVTAGGRIFSLK